jgi:hypothetical protein
VRGYASRGRINVFLSAARQSGRDSPESRMAERSRTRRNTLERRCLPKTFKRMFIGAPKGIFKMLEKVKKA